MPPYLSRTRVSLPRTLAEWRSSSRGRLRGSCAAYKAGISAGDGALSQRRGAVMGEPVARAGSLLLGRNLEKGGSQNANETKGAAGFPPARCLCYYFTSLFSDILWPVWSQPGGESERRVSDRCRFRPQSAPTSARVCTACAKSHGLAGS